jgi:tetratricopeptide (TPR) repeat protein
MKAKLIPHLLFLISLGNCFNVYAQNTVEVREVNRAMPTYNFSDPNPVPSIGRIYPYYRFDGYAGQPEDKEWKFIELGNDYIKVFITPEIGGKIWGAIEKSTGNEFIYFNNVVKFRDVAMRGPWTSGGIESNFGVIGHAPTCSSPVDYIIRKNEDGSVSCFIGAIDLPSRTEWRVEINLHPDKSSFTTKALWHNPTQMEHSYYQWMNAGVKTEGNLEYSYPGTNYIGHDGSLHSWPIHADGMDISWYEKNNFGGYKSYHVIGELTNFFGGYWHDDNFGFGHYANYSGKPGKKLWIWGLSRQGMIWENLLTDNDGQYTEIQSGRLFNQEAAESISTPFKHRSFAPFSTDVWAEYWFPVMTTNGVIQANPRASVNLEVEKGNLHIWLSANEIIDDSLLVQTNNKTIGEFKLLASPTDVIHKIMPFEGSTDQISIKIGTEYIIGPGGTASQRLSRPLKTVDFDWTTVQGMAMKAKSLEQERNYAASLEQYSKCLQKDPNYLPALAGAAGLYFRKTAYSKALKLASRALAIDAYHTAANFIYGAVNVEMGNETDAIDGFSIAASSVEYKSAAFLELGRIYFKRGELNKTLEYAEKSLDYNSNNLSSIELLLVVHRKLTNKADFEEILGKTLKKDPLNHMARFENYLMSNNNQDLEQFKSLIRNELPHETFLEIAIKYYNLGLIPEAEKVLTASPESAMVSYWLAYVIRNIDSANSEKHLIKANNFDPAFVFPFRQESIAVLQWVAKSSESWQPKYYLALIWWTLGNVKEAQELFIAIGNEPKFMPFYLAKADLFKDASEIATESIKMAHEISPNDWRATLKLADNYLSKNDVGKAIKTIEPVFKKYPANYYLGLNYAKALMLNDQNGKCQNLLQNLMVLPNEGATEGRHLYRISSLNLALEAIGNNEYELAMLQLNIAKSWPENLGVGKPYITDESIEKYIEAMVLRNSGKSQKADLLLQTLIRKNQAGNIDLITANDIIELATYVQLGQNNKAEEHVKTWQNNYPDDEFVIWGTKWLEGGSVELTVRDESIINNTSAQRIGSREFYLMWAIDFLNDNPIKD